MITGRTLELLRRFEPLRKCWTVLLLAIASGCNTRPLATVQIPTSPYDATPVARVTQAVETRFDLRGYRDPADHTLRHEPHAIFRTTWVPISGKDYQEISPRESNAAISYAPLPLNDELKAELSKQREITNELYVLQSSIAETERKVQAQYAALASETFEALNLRIRLEKEKVGSSAEPTAETVVVPRAKTDHSPTSEVKW